MSLLMDVSDAAGGAPYQMLENIGEYVYSSCASQEILLSLLKL